jgi:hypothetical protein
LKAPFSHLPAATGEASFFAKGPYGNVDANLRR